MSVLASAVRTGAYRDSIVLMQLQVALAEQPGIEDAGAVMATPENLALLAASGLLPDPAPAVGPTDLLAVVRAQSEPLGRQALGRIDDLLRRESAGTAGGFRPHSLAAAVRLLPEARFALISVPGRYAAEVATRALDLGLHVFLYSDNVGLEDEVELKRRARDAGLLVMGPDCGTAIVGGVGLGFANRVRRGGVGIVAASGTGLQAVAAAVHRLGGGVSQGIGTGGRDLSAPVGASTARQALDVLRRDPDTQVIVLVSKPPSAEVADRLLRAARSAGKPVVVAFQGYEADLGAPLHLATDLQDAARLGVSLCAGDPTAGAPVTGALEAPEGEALAPYVRGLFSGGTLALEALLKLRGHLDPLRSNLKVEGTSSLPDPHVSAGHVVLDLGADELTLGRPHPMIDNDLRLRRLRQEAGDPDVGLIMLDVVLGYGAHPDPASDLAPLIAETERPDLAVVVILIGTDEDPQGLEAQSERLEGAGALVCRDVGSAVACAVDRLGAKRRGDAPHDVAAGPMTSADPRAETHDDSPADGGAPVPLDDLAPPIAAVNVGLERFAKSLAAQDAKVIQVDWRPPAGGDARLLDILEKLRR